MHRLFIFTALIDFTIVFSNQHVCKCKCTHVVHAYNMYMISLPVTRFQNVLRHAIGNSRELNKLKFL